MRSTAWFVTAAVILSTPTDGHVVLENPKPFLAAEYGPSNPVLADTFPCKVPAGGKLEIDGSPTKMAIGQDQLLTFVGQAVHGGGSCQISLTSDIDDEFQPSKDSRFRVIHSIEGGCPARNQKGNLEGPNVDKYYFKIPTGVDPGNHVLAWTWVARIGGSPEFYMECAPIVVTSSNAKAKRIPMAERRDMSLQRREDFPDLFMANMGKLTGGCTHDEARTQQIAVGYPEPGTSIDIPDPDEALFPQACNGNPRVRTGSGSDPGTSTSLAGTLSSQVTSPEAQPTSTATSSLTVSDLDSFPATNTAGTTLVTSTALMTNDLTSTGPVSTTVRSSSTDTSTPATTYIPGSGGSSVCQEGYLLCVGGTQFSTCTGGQWTGPQPLASGTQCTGTDGTGLDIVPL